MRRLIALLLLLAASLLFLGGCSDDEEPLAPAPAPKYLIVGMVILRPYVDFMGTITPINGQANEIDSVLIGDSSATIAKTGSYVEGNNYAYNFAYFNPDDSLRFHSGDTATIRIVNGSEVATVRLKLVAMPDDSLKPIDQPPSSSVPRNTEVTFEWQSAANADWYSVYYIYDTSIVFGSELTIVYDYATDTTYTVPASILTANGELRMFIAPVTGPIPGLTGNVKSTTMTGSFYSWAIPGVREPWTVNIGAGLPSTPLKTNEVSTRKMLDQLRLQYIMQVNYSGELAAGIDCGKLSNRIPLHHRQR